MNHPLIHGTHSTGVHNDGNIYNPENLVHFRDYVMSQTDNQGVCFTMADGVCEGVRGLLRWLDNSYEDISGVSRGL